MTYTTAQNYKWLEFEPEGAGKLPDLKALYDMTISLSYCCAFYGSMKNDCDVVAIPFRDDVCTPIELIGAVCYFLKGKRRGPITIKQAGRIACTIDLGPEYKLLDFSVMPIADMSYRL